MDQVQIFISYAREDETRVKELYHRLIDAGFHPWLDREHILPGQRWELTIKQALKHSDFALICLSATSINKRGFLQKEIKQALEHAQEKLEDDVWLIPARLDDCDVPDSLSSIQWVDLYENDGWEQLLRALEFQLKKIGKRLPSQQQEFQNISRIAASYILPLTEMLTPPAPRSELSKAELMERARQLAEKCAEFNVFGQVKQICPGPVVTTFEFKPDPGVKYNRITSLVDALRLAFKAESVRIDRIPDTSCVGIEVPNSNREIIRLREVLESKSFHESKSKLMLGLGKTTDGANYVADLAKMPHLLIADATGAGKSVALSTILASLLYKASPEEVKLILIDPKRLELGLYGDIPHLLSPIVSDPKRGIYALKWVVAEMERRQIHLSSVGVRNIDQYNAEVNATANSKRGSGFDSEEGAKPLPYIVVIIGELADLMMVSARDVEESITYLAQMARNVGIHLVLATQRPSVDVITRLIKAYFPTRISFRVSSKVDSHTIIDTNGAEQLLGQGDMLFLPPGTSRLVRVHGAYIDEREVKRISNFVRSQAQPAHDEKIALSEMELQKDKKYDEAVRIVIEMGRASTSVLQRRLRIDYERASSIIYMMERKGIVGPEDGHKPRQVLVKADFLERLDQIREEDDL